MRIRVLAFARLRELIGAGSQSVDLPQGSVAADLWSEMALRHAGLQMLAESTRIARNGHIVTFSEPLEDGDEVALLPPVGGG